MNEWIFEEYKEKKRKIELRRMWLYKKNLMMRLIDSVKGNRSKWNQWRNTIKKDGRRMQVGRGDVIGLENQKSKILQKDKRNKT
jgi:hypothetical protein